MTTETILPVLRNLYGLANVPSVLYEEGVAIAAVPAAPPSCLMRDAEAALIAEPTDNKKQAHQACYYVDCHNFVFGKVVDPDSSARIILLGPLLTVPLSPADIHGLVQTLGAATQERREELTSYLTAMPRHTMEQVFHTISLLFHCLSGKAFPITELVARSADSEKNMEQKQVRTSYSDRELYETKHNYLYEQQFLSYIRSGNPRGLQAFFKNAPDIHVGTVAANPIRQEKNIFVAATTMALRAAIEGGMAEPEAYALGYLYMFEMEQLSSTEEIYELQYEMIFDFASRVQDVRLPKDVGPYVFQASQYIASHVAEPISAESVASALGISRPYLSRLFSDEMGIPIGTYITDCKIREAKRLLLYTDRTISEISSYLCFSSQPYFQNVFKKNVGVTPARFRNQASTHRSA